MEPKLKVALVFILANAGLTSVEFAVVWAAGSLVVPGVAGVPILVVGPSFIGVFVVGMVFLVFGLGNLLEPDRRRLAPAAGPGIEG